MPSTLSALLLIVAILALAFLCGPRPTLEPSVVSTSIPDELNDLTLWLEQQEQRFDDITPGTEKHIVWHNSDLPTQTDIAILYLHGFTATHREIAPLPQQLAKSLGANLYLPRLTGHGRGYQGMKSASAQQWLQDAWDAYRLAEKLGKRVIIIATSTGAPLSVWLAEQRQVQDTLEKMILISANFGLSDPKSKLLAMPWADFLVPMLVGNSYGSHSDDPEVERFWTNRYPTQAAIEMYQLVQWVQQRNFGDLLTPTFFIYSKDDDIVAPKDIEKAVEKWGGPTKTLLLDGDVDSSLHVVAGDLLNPQNNAKAFAAMSDFVRDKNSTQYYSMN